MPKSSFPGSLDRLSGPVSAYAMDVDLGAYVKGSRTCEVLLFGDMHFSYARRCPRCSSTSRSSACLGIARYIKKITDEHDGSNGSLDVYMELPTINAADGSAVVDEQMRSINEMMAADKEPPGGSGSSGWRS